MTILRSPLLLSKIFPLVAGALLVHLSGLARSSGDEDAAADLFSDPTIASLSVSPDGVRVAYFVRKNGQHEILVAPLAHPARGKSIASSVGRPVALHWLPGAALLAIEEAGDEQRWRVVTPDSSRPPTTVFRHAAAATRGPKFLGLDQSGRILLSLDRERPWVPDVYRIDREGGGLERVETNPGDVFAWIVDPRGAIRLARRWRVAGDSLRYEIVFRRHAGAAWRVLAAHRLEQPEVRPLGFTPRGGSLYLAQELQTGRQRIRRLDPVSGQPDGWSLTVHGEYLESLQHERSAGRLALVNVESERPGRRLLHAPWRAPLASLARQAPESRMRLAGSGDAGSLWLVDADREPGAYYLVSDGSARQVLALQPPLQDFAAAPMRPMSFTSRDGQSVGAYWTPGGGGRGPLVLLIHGGPWRRDRWGWNAEAQWLARLGYHVLQVNYRGSRGVSHRWLRQGRRQWGLKMQHDLEDAIAWAVTAGIADPARVCAMGGSYGGYAALMLLAADSRPLRCAVGRAPVTDLVAQIESIRQRGNERGYREWVEMVGDPRTDAERLAAHSPLTQAARLGGAVLLAHGTRDRTVDVSQSRSLAVALKARGAEVEWLPLEGQGHRYLEPPLRLAYYRAVAAFLERQLGAY